MSDDPTAVEGAGAGFASDSSTTSSAPAATAGLAFGFFAFGIWFVGLPPIPRRAAMPPPEFATGWPWAEGGIGGGNQTRMTAAWPQVQRLVVIQ